MPFIPKPFPKENYDFLCQTLSLGSARISESLFTVGKPPIICGDPVHFLDTVTVRGPLYVIFYYSIQYRRQAMLPSDSIRYFRVRGSNEISLQKKFQGIKEAIEKDKWHHITIEMIGNQISASFKNHEVSSIDDMWKGKPKRLGLHVAGGPSKYRNLKMWEALPKD